MLFRSLIAALPQMSAAQRSCVDALFANPTPDDAEIADVVAIVTECGGIEFARRKGEEFAAQAEEALAPVPGSPARQSLADALTGLPEESTRIAFHKDADRRLSSIESRTRDICLAIGPEGGFSPVFSPDGSQIAFQTQAPNEIKVVSLSGAPPLTVATEGVAAFALAWGDDGFLYTTRTQAAGSGIAKVPAKIGRAHV